MNASGFARGRSFCNLDAGRPRTHSGARPASGRLAPAALCIRCEHPSLMADLKPIQCSTGPFWAFELDQTLDLIAEAGFTDVELMVTRDRRTQHPEIPARLAEERDLKIASVHGPFLAITKTVWGQDTMGKVTRGVEMCRELGADTYVVHPPFLWERRFARWIEKESEAYSAE